MSKMGPPDWKIGVLLVATVLLCGCSGVLHPDPQISTSTAFEPPSAWESAVSFSFADSTYFPNHPYAARIELRIEGHRGRVITGRDLFTGPGGGLTTAWYRVPLPSPGSRALSLHVVLTDTSGAESSADYPLLVERDRFYEVHFGVASTRPPRPEAPPRTEGLRGYAVQPAARMQSTDSLWIAYKFRTRDCFNCVF
ncbi:hypothetical protein [Longimicrobium sp.]|uniref:hypothetical protein n=1 Tax=Longimicrobium sp. TaxID=2029185 RepID=UPI003B3AED42